MTEESRDAAFYFKKNLKFKILVSRTKKSNAPHRDLKHMSDNDHDGAVEVRFALTEPVTLRLTAARSNQLS